MKLKGTVRNVVDFGAVDIGVKQTVCFIFRKSQINLWKTRWTF